MSGTEMALGESEVEVVAKRTRRRFTVEYKRKIVREADSCKTPGAVGALLRREGLYSSHLTVWRAARERGELAGAPKKRGPAPQVADPRDKKIVELERETARWRKRAERAEALVEVQKKLAVLLGTLPAGRPGDHKDAQPAARLQRQAVLRGPVQDAEVPAGVPRTVPGSIQDARGHYHVFFPWYNTEHHHTGLGLLTPYDVHHGLAEQRRTARATVLAAAYAAHPERFPAGLPHPPALPLEVWINPPRFNPPMRTPA